MEKQKIFLLIAGGGTLGSYTAKDLLERGHRVDVICLEDTVSQNPNLRYFQTRVSDEYLEELFSREHYDGIVNFLHYADPEVFKRSYPVLMQGTEHLVFLSSYRVYADEEHPITENSPRLLDVVTDPDFLDQEDYAIPKARCEDFLRSQHAGEPWTIVRPVISFSHLRLDMYMYSKHSVLERAKENSPVILPAFAKDFTAGLDWAGNSGKLIARLLEKKHTFGNTYTVSSEQGLTWGQIADIYSRLTGAQFQWVDEEAFLEAFPMVKPQTRWMYYYDRHFDRCLDASAIREATGLQKQDFASIEDGLKIELEKIGFTR